MNFIQIHSYYEPYLQQFYERQPELREASYATQMEAIITDGFTGCHIITPYLHQYGATATLIIANNPYTQEQWARENNFSAYTAHDWQHSIVAKQIETLRPEMLYISHPIGYDSAFLRHVAWQPSFVFGWRSADIPKDLDVSAFHLMLTSCEPCYKGLLEHGAQAVEYHSPGIPDSVWDAVKDTAVEEDVTFVGQWSHAHKRRAEYLKAIGKSPLGFKGEFSIAYHLLVANPEELPASVAMHNKGPVYGLDMYRALRRARIGINGIIDFAGKEAGNMRMFEVTASGALLLTEEDPSIDKYFEPGKELVTFKDSADLIDKIYYFLEHSEEREAIARRGRERCYAEHSLSQKVKQMVQLIEQYCTTASTSLSVPAPKKQNQPYSKVELLDAATQASALTLQALQEFKNHKPKEALETTTIEEPDESVSEALKKLEKREEILSLKNLGFALYPKEQPMSTVPQVQKPEPKVSKRAKLQVITSTTLAPVSPLLIHLRPAGDNEPEAVQRMLQETLRRIDFDPQAALACVEIAEHMAAYHENVHYLKGLCHLKLGMPQNAKECFRNELRLFPHKTEVEALLKELS